MIRCVKCNREIVSIRAIQKITSVPSTEKNVVECICKQCWPNVCIQGWNDYCTQNYGTILEPFWGETPPAEVPGKNYKLCIRCKKTVVEALPFTVHEEDEMCKWCRLALKAGIDDFKLFSEAEEKKSNPYINMDDDELEAQSGLEDLEDYGAFTDEGIMPGCHSYSHAAEEYNKYNRRTKEIGQLIKAAREKIGLSTAQLAKAVDIPEYVEQNIENGLVSVLHKEKSTPIPVIPVPAASKADENNNAGLNGEHCVEAKKWWESCDDDELREEVLKYLYIHCAS